MSGLVLTGSPTAVVQPLDSPDRRGADDRLVVCATGVDEGGEESVALWWTSLSGEPKAGWLFPVEVAEQDAAVARRLLAAAEYGRPVGRGPAEGWAVLACLARRAGRAATGIRTAERARRRRAGDPGPRPDRRGSPPLRVVNRDRCALVADVLEACRLIGWATYAGPTNEPSLVEQWLRRRPLPKLPRTPPGQREAAR